MTDDTPTDNPQSMDPPENAGGDGSAAPAVPSDSGVDAGRAFTGRVSLGDKFFIHPDKPLPQYNQGPVKAYGVSTSNGAGPISHYALICDPALSPRSRLAGAYSNISNPNVVRLVGSGIVFWAPVGEERYTFVYEGSAGMPLMGYNDLRGLDMRPDMVVANVVKPLLAALIDIRNADIAHGNIRPSNIYATMSGGAMDRVVLGDCLSMPPSFSQPVLFETIERGMADPIARGTPTIETDLYALGVTIALLLRSRDPMEGLSGEDIVRYKIENGSYVALTSRDRFSGAILELLRGLLYDDPKQRWTLDDVQQWLDGQRLTPKPATKKLRAARPLHFNDERYLRPPLLAMDLGKDQSGAVQLIENGQMEQWISRSLEDPQVMKRYESMQESLEETGRGAGYWDRLLCRLSIVLDPDAPIRYKGVSITVDGIGTALSAACVRGDDLSPYAEMVTQQTILFWINAAPDTQGGIGTLINRFDSCRAFMRQNTLGYGLERCIYFLNPESHCLSDKLKGYIVRTQEDLLHAFEKMADSPKRPELFLDRHIVAFLSVKDRRDIDPYLMEINAVDVHKRILGNIKTLATIQQRTRMEKMPGICAWCVDIIDPVLEQLHDRRLRAALAEKVRKLAPSGDIAKIVIALDDAKIVQDDTRGYNAARMEYYELRQEQSELENRLLDAESLRVGFGREVAAIFSCILSGMIILFVAFMFFTNGSIF